MQVDVRHSSGRKMTSWASHYCCSKVDKRKHPGRTSRDDKGANSKEPLVCPYAVFAQRLLLRLRYHLRCIATNERHCFSPDTTPTAYIQHLKHLRVGALLRQWHASTAAILRLKVVRVGSQDREWLLANLTSRVHLTLTSITYYKYSTDLDDMPVQFEREHH